MDSKLTGTGNDGFFHRYSFEKGKGFRKIFLKFMDVLGFEEKDVKEKFHQKYESSPEDEEYVNVDWTVDAEELTDVFWHFENDKFDVEVFFGDKKIFVIVRAENREDFVNFLKREIQWKSEEDFEKARKENSEKLKKRATEEVKKRSGNKIHVRVR